MGAGLLFAACQDSETKILDEELVRQTAARSSRLSVAPNLTIPLEVPWRLRGEIESWTFLEADSDPLGPWKYSGPDIQLAPDSGLTISKLANKELEQLLNEGRATPRLTLRMDERLSKLDTVEIDVLVRQTCTAEVVLRFDNGQQITRQFKVPGSAELQTASFPIGWLERSWLGLLELEIRPDIDQPQEVQLQAIRLLRNGLALGPEATEAQPFGLSSFGVRDAPPEPKTLTVEDVGLVGPGRELVRGHVQREGTSLTTSSKNYGPTRISTSVLPGWQAHRDKGAWHAAIIQVTESGERTILAQLNVDLDAQEGLPKWRTLECVLPPNDEPQETHLFAWSGPSEPPPFEVETLPVWGAAPRCAAIWGAPFKVDSGATNSRPNIVLVTLDTTRADLAYDPKTAPFLGQLRNQGTSFERAWSAANTTAPSHASLFTGRPVHEHGTFTNGVYPLSRDLLTLAESLRAEGYRTIAATNVEHLGSRFQFGQGFDVYLDPPTSGIAVDGADTLEMLAPWLDQLEDEAGAPPLFLWVHLFDAHVPYRVPDDFAATLEARGLGLPLRSIADGDMPKLRKTPDHLAWLGEDVNSASHLAALYRQGVAYVDHLTGELYADLESRGLNQNTIFTVTSDHGESLGEQDFWATHASIYPSIQRIPLIFRGPGIPHHVEAFSNVSSLDVLHTLANLAGIRKGAEWSTPDLLGRESDSLDKVQRREIWFEAQTLSQIGRVQGDSYFITNIADVNMGLREATATELRQRPFTHYSATYREGDTELYDLAVDPGLFIDLSEKSAALAEALDKRARAIVQAGLQIRNNRDQAGLTPRERERLSALGYTD